MLIPLRTSTKRTRLPVVVALLVVVNVVVFLVTRENLAVAVQRWGFRPPESLEAFLLDSRSLSSLHTILTHAFLHGGWLHLIGNLWMLVVFGVAVESRTGSILFAALYLACVLMAIAAHAALQAGPIRPAIGASGAISGIIGCYIALEPRSRVLSLFFLGVIIFVTEVPSVFYIAVWLVLQIDAISTRVLTGPGCRNIAWWAHIGGFLGGVVLGIGLRLLAKRRQATVCG